MRFRTKTLSLLLVALMMLSCISVSFQVLAAESTEKPAKTAAPEEKLNELFALNISLGTAKPQITVDESDPKYVSQKERVEKCEKAQALYKEILPMYKAMNDSEKDAVDITLALKFLQNGINQEAYDLAVAANPDKPTVTNELKSAGQEKLFEKIGPHTAHDEAIKASEKLWEPVGTRILGKNEVPVFIATYLDFSAYEPAAQVLADFIAAYKAASPMVRRYMDGTTSNTKGYGVTLIGGKLTDIVKTVAQKEMTLDGKKYTEPKPPATDKEATQKWNAANYNHEADLDYDAFLSVTEGLEDLKNVREAVTLLRTGYQDFLATSDVTKAEEGIKAYEALDAYEQLFYSKLTFKSVAFASVNNKGVWSNTQVNTNKLYDKCVDARNNGDTENSKPVTDTPSVPKTAGVVSSAGAAFSVALSAAVVIFAIRRRRDTTE